MVRAIAPTDRRASSSRWASAARSSGNLAWILGVSSPRAAAASACSAFIWTVSAAICPMPGHFGRVDLGRQSAISGVSRGAADIVLASPALPG